MLKRETYINRIRPFIGRDVIKVLTGIRRCGKSVILELLREELLANGAAPGRIFNINFERVSDREWLDGEFLHARVLEMAGGGNEKFTLFLDEVQLLPKWEYYVNSLRTYPNLDIYVTGSNAHLLSGELATLLTGRYVRFEIQPFSFAEYVGMQRLLKNEKTVAEIFNDYMTTGGMPFIARGNMDYDSAMQYLNDIYQTILWKDVVRRHKIRDTDLLERIVLFVISNIGRTFSATSVSKYLKNERRSASTDTVLNYIKACEDAFLFYRVRRNDLLGKQLLTVNEKYYIADHGLREAIYKNNTRDRELIFENMVYIELRRRGYDVTVGKVGDLEVDFVAEKQGRPVYIQVAYYLLGEETIKREFGVLEKFVSNYPKYVLSMDDFDMSGVGIKHINIRDFLLGKEL
jgi:predicted AAA+ superfamily ATPase